MWQLWVFTVFCVVFLWWAPMARCHMVCPPSTAEDHFESPALDGDLRVYRLNAIWRICFLVGSLLLTLAFYFGGLRSHDGEMNPVLICYVISFLAFNHLAAFCTSLVIVRRRTVWVNKHYPELGIGTSSPKATVISVVLHSLAVLFFAISMMLPADYIAPCLVAAGVLIIAQSRYNRVALRKMMIPIAPESPLGERLNQVVRAMGFTPKGANLLPTLWNNAVAMPDGSVLVTTALRGIATDEEIAAIIAHELSHQKHQDLKAYKNYLAVGIGAAAGFTVYVALKIIDKGFDTFWVIGTTLCLWLFTVQLGNLWHKYESRKREFRCDHAAKELGLGSALATGLVKVYRYNRVPARWFPTDRFLMTHPSLEERLERLSDG